MADMNVKTETCTVGITVKQIFRWDFVRSRQPRKKTAADFVIIYLSLSPLSKFSLKSLQNSSGRHLIWLAQMAISNIIETPDFHSRKSN